MTNIVPLQNTKLRPLRALNKFTNDADWLVDRNDELASLLPQTKEAADRLRNGDEIAALFAHAKKLAALSERDEERIARCNDALERFDPASVYENNDRERLRRNVVVERVAVVVGSFPNDAPSDPAMYIATMVDGICTVDDLTLPALEAGIWEVVTTLKFLPAPCEVLEVVNRQQEEWVERFWAITDIADQSRRLLTQLDQLESEAQEAAKARVIEQAQRDLDAAFWARGNAKSKACDAQLRAAVAAQEVAAAMNRLANRDVVIAEKGQALAELIAAESKRQ